MDGISLVDVSLDYENSLINVSLEDDGCLISSCCEEKTLEMDDWIPLIDVSSDGDDCLIDVSLEDNDCLISSRSGFACKSKKKGKIAPCLDVSCSTKSTRVAGMKKESEVSLSPAAAAAASHMKRRIVGKKKEEELALLPTAAAAPSKSKDAKRKKDPIAVNNKIPQGTIMMVLPILLGQSKRYKTHAYLAGKKVILYGLPGYKHEAVSSLDFPEFRARCETWNTFRLVRVMKPALEFIKQVECLIGKGVDEVLFFTVNCGLLQSGFNNQTTHEKFEFFKFVYDLYSFHPKSYYTALGLEIDMQEDTIPSRSRTRRFMLLVDNLKVKFANIESSDGHFIVPSVEEIFEAFHQ